GNRTDHAYQLDCRSVPLAAQPGVFDFIAATPNSLEHRRLPLVLRNDSPSAVTINCLRSTHAAFSSDLPLPTVLAAGSQVTVHVTFDRTFDGNLDDERLYVRSVSDRQLIAVPVKL